MKTKKCLLYILAMLLCISSSTATPKIEIKGDDTDIPVLKSIYQPIVLLSSNMSIDLLFRANLGQVAIAVEDENGNTTYSSTTQVCNGKLHSISCVDWELGYYTISVTTPSLMYTWRVELVEE